VLVPSSQFHDLENTPSLFSHCLRFNSLPTSLARTVFNPRLTAVYKLDMSEGEVSNFSIKLPLPLSIDGHFSNLHYVSNLQSQGCFIISIGNPALLDSSICWQGPLNICVTWFNIILYVILSRTVAS